MQTILLNTLLCLVIFWLLLLIYYTYCYILFSRRWGKLEEKVRSDKTEKEVERKTEGTHTLVSRSKGLSSEDFPTFLATPKPEVEQVQANTFALSKAEEVAGANDTTEEQSSDVSPISEEENEMQVAFTTDEVDEDEVAKEEILIFRDPMPEVSPSAILARDLVRMGRWSKNDDELDDEEAVEIQATLSKVQDTDLMEKYLENLKAEEWKHSKLLAVVRKAEEARMKAETTTSDSKESRPATVNEKPLDYYL